MIDILEVFNVVSDIESRVFTLKGVITVETNDRALVLAVEKVDLFPMAVEVNTNEGSSMGELILDGSMIHDDDGILVIRLIHLPLHEFLDLVAWAHTLLHLRQIISYEMFQRESLTVREGKVLQLAGGNTS